MYKHLTGWFCRQSTAEQQASFHPTIQRTPVSVYLSYNTSWESLQAVMYLH